MRIVAYIADWSFHRDLTPDEAACLTHVHYSFGLIKDGAVSIDHLTQLDRLGRLQKQFPLLKVSLSVGGWGAGGFSEAVATPEGRQRLTDSAVDIARRLNLTGIDWDWEYPGSDAAGIACSPEDPARMSDLLVEMRAKLDALGKETGRSYEQTIAVGADRTGDYDWPRVLPALDTVNLMTYDMTTPGKANHATNLLRCSAASYSAQQSVADFHRAGVPKEKLLLGAAFYCHAYNGVTLPDPLGKAYAGKGRNLPHDAITESWQRRWDEKAQAAYWLSGDSMLSGDDEASLAAKRQFVLNEGLGGVIIWELNHDRQHRLLPVLAGKTSSFTGGGNMEKVLQFLKDADVYYLATMEGDQPRVRPFGTIHLFEGKLYIQTGRVKPVAQQLKANPKAELCAFKGGAWLRIACRLTEDDRVEARKSMLDAYPQLRAMYDENDGNTQVYAISDAVATFSSFGGAPEIVTF